MGIKQFFKWFRTEFKTSITPVPLNGTAEVPIDTLLVDMNSIFHTAAQKVFRYGQYSGQKQFLSKPYMPPNNNKNQIKVYAESCRLLEYLVKVANPQKRVVMCIDGPAPIAKQCQQRQRRFVSARDHNPDQKFDSNAITPGTVFMDHLSKYIDWYLRKEMSDENSIWSRLEVIFSNEKVPGEGEHKLFNYLRKFADNANETYCINGMDADLIMLTLGSQLDNFYILRDNQYNRDSSYDCIDIGAVRKQLVTMLDWSEESNHTFNPTQAVNDFVFMCFMVGNDFLPHMPAIEIAAGGLELMIQSYLAIGIEHGHLTNGSQFNPDAVKVFLETLSLQEKTILQNKASNRADFFPDEILDRNTADLGDGQYEVDIDTYRDEYYQEKLPDVDIKELCHHYLDGMQWVFDYYLDGVPNWSWYFDYHYAPFAHTLARHVKDYQFKRYEPSSPTEPFLQLLTVLPPLSARLLPAPLDTFLASGMSEYCPMDFQTDLAGKRNTWEQVVLIPKIDYRRINRKYRSHVRRVSERDARRNVVGQHIRYQRGDREYFFKSYYGNIGTCVQTSVIAF